MIPTRSCSSCLAHDVRRAATHVARDADGLEWFECGRHSEVDNPSEVVRVSLTPMKAWFTRHGLFTPKDETP